MKPVRVLYVGPVLAGKTTNLQAVHSATGGQLTSLATETERTLSFEASLPCDEGALRVTLLTVPGAIFYNQSRVRALRDVDAMVFVADAQVERTVANREEANLLRANLRTAGIGSVPVILQANKQDIPGVLDAEALLPWFSELAPLATIDACAMQRVGVLESLRAALAAVTQDAARVRWDALAATSRSERFRVDTEPVQELDLSDDGDAGRAFRSLRDGTKPRRLRIRGAHAIPPEIGTLRTLEYLDLQDLDLDELPAEIGALDSLRTLRLRRNSLTRLPPEIGRLRALNQLWLDDNRLESLPAEIGQLNALQFLSLDGNQRLETLPASLGTLPLRALFMRRVPLTSLPDAFGSLTSLEVLSMQGTRFPAVPPVLGRLPALQMLELRENQPALEP